MADDPDAVSLPGIAALPPATANQIGSGQVLVDPSSVVKELIDNALDARAKSIFVDITANTIDSIQVKDDGHGIPAEDRALVCRRYCTSKIRDFHDLRNVGGKWLGFRGEALASMAEMSGTFSIATRVEGEPVAVKLKYGRNGELSSTERESHPVGTTVKVSGFFEYVPVRKQTAAKSSAKWLVRIRHLMQAYALARPSVRFRLHILKAKNTKGDFVYAPKADFNIEDSVLKVIGKDCALQCDWTAIEKDGFEVHAFLPKPTAIGANIANQGTFLSVDSRPVSPTRGTMKQVAAAFKDRLRKSNIALRGVKDPFFCMNIICPPDSYDPNIEPAKDDVLFENESLVVGVVDDLLKAFYPEAIPGESDFKPPTSAQTHQDIQRNETTRDQTPLSIYEDARESQSDEALVEGPRKQPRWRSSMYSIDEDDLEFLQENQPPIVEEEEGLRNIAISNPWTIARMNAPIKPRRLTDNGQLLSPTKSQSNGVLESSSPVTAKTPLLPLSSDPLTPQTLSRRNLSRSSLDIELEQSIQPFASSSSGGHVIMGAAGIAPAFDGQSSILSSGSEGIRVASPRQNQRKNPINASKPFAPPAQQSSDTWFGQPMRGSQLLKPPRRQTRSKKQELPLFPSDTSSNLRRSNPSGAENLIGNRLHSENNTDIRSFFGKHRRTQNSHVGLPVLSSSFTPINGRVHHVDIRGSTIPLSTQHETPLDGNSKATSVEPYPQSKYARGYPIESFDLDRNADSVDMAAQFRAYATRDLPRPSSVRSTIAMHFNSEPNSSRSPLRQHRTNVAGSELHKAPQHSQISEDDDSHLHDCTSFLKEYQDLSTNRVGNPVQRNGSRLTPAHEKTSKPCRARRRTTDALERTKSAELPLERVPQEYRIQDVISYVATSVKSIIQVSRKLDMKLNSPEWGYPVEDTYDVFAERVAERRIMEWVINVDEILHEKYERVGGVDTRCVLHEGVQRGLDDRKGQDSAVKSIEVISVRDDDSDDGTVGEMNGSSAPNIEDEGIIKPSCTKHTDIDDGPPRSQSQHAVTKAQPEEVNEDMAGFDMLQFVDLDEDMTTTVENSTDTGPEQADEDDGDIEDEMLMGL